MLASFLAEPGVSFCFRMTLSPVPGSCSVAACRGETHIQANEREHRHQSSLPVKTSFCWIAMTRPF
jgi:hypothetical protein